MKKKRNQVKSKPSGNSSHLRLNIMLYKQRNKLQRAIMEALEELNRTPPSDFAEHPMNIVKQKLQDALDYVQKRDKKPMQTPRAA